MNHPILTAIAGFMLLVVSALALTAVASPWVFWLSEQVYPFAFHRVFNRTAMILFIAGAAVLFMRLKVKTPRDLGYPASRQDFVNGVLPGFAWGVVMMSCVSAVLLALGARELRTDPAESLLAAIGALPQALLSGLAVGFVEETFFRGALYTTIRRDSPAFAAAIATALLYATVHFFGEKIRIAPENVDAFSGLLFLSQFFGKFSQPLAILDAFVALFLVGVLLALVRERTGHIAASIGLHAGFVATIVVVKRISRPVFASDFGFLINRIDGIVGWLVALAAAIAVTLIYMRQPEMRASRLR